MEELRRFIALDEDGPDGLRQGNWENVTDHCVMEAARARVFADLLGLDAPLKKDLMRAALLHDGHKRREVEAIQQALREGGSGYRASTRVTAAYLQELKGKNIPDRIIHLIDFAGGMPETVLSVKAILDKAHRSSDDLAALAMHYIDAYTRGSMWVERAEVAAGGRSVNDLDRRIERNRNNPDYWKIAEEIAGIFRDNPFFSRRTVFEAMVAVDHDIERLLAPRLSAGAGKPVDPLQIPEFIDGTIKGSLRK